MKRILLALIFSFLLAGVPVFAGDVKLMDKEELKSLLGSEDLVVLDVRTGRDWSSSEFKIQGAVRAPTADFTSWGKTYTKDKTIVLYCA